jgi:hypothetical protein
MVMSAMMWISLNPINGYRLADGLTFLFSLNDGDYVDLIKGKSELKFL